MPKINVNVKHELKKNEAVERVKELLKSLKTNYGDMVKDLEENWTNDSATFSFKAMGMSVSGELNVDDSSLVVNGKIPLTALPFKKTIEGKIYDEATKLLS